MKVLIANYNEHYLVDVSTRDEREMLFCLVQSKGGMDAIKESDVIITLNYDKDDEEYYKVEKNTPELNSVEIESLLEEFKSTESYKPFVKKYTTDFRYIVIDYDAGCINKTNDLNDEILSMIEQGYYRVIDLETMETIDHNGNGLFRKNITEY